MVSLTSYKMSLILLPVCTPLHSSVTIEIAVDIEHDKQ